MRPIEKEQRQSASLCANTLAGAVVVVTTTVRTWHWYSVDSANSDLLFSDDLGPSSIAYGPINALTQQVRVTVVTSVLFDHVNVDPPQICRG